MKYRRVLLKLSGECLGNEESNGLDSGAICKTVESIKKALSHKIQLAIVIGGGNIWRGANKDVDRVTADYMGMMATIINALALKDVFEKFGVPVRVLSAIEVSKVAELYVRDIAVNHLENNRVVILAGGTGNPFFTTDTTAALRAAELKADVLFKATQVDGVYSEDPRKNPDAKKYTSITFDEAISKNLKVMDTSAFAICRENRIPIVVFNFHIEENLYKILDGENIGTLVI